MNTSAAKAVSSGTRSTLRNTSVGALMLNSSELYQLNVDEFTHECGERGKGDVTSVRPSLEQNRASLLQSFI